MRISTYVFVVFVLAGAAAQAAPWLGDWEASQAKAGKDQPILIYFRADWCASCRQMEDTVLSGRSFGRVSKRVVLLKADIDTTEGRKLKDKYLAFYTPTFVLVMADGGEIGRILGPHPENWFIAKLSGLLSRGRRGNAGSKD